MDILDRTVAPMPLFFQKLSTSNFERIVSVHPYRMPSVFALLVICGIAVSSVHAAPPPKGNQHKTQDKQSLDQQFEQIVKPFVTKHCVGCHSGNTPAAQFDLKAYTSVDTVTRDYPRWDLVMERLLAKDMPPKPIPAPPAAANQHVIDWIEVVKASEIKRLAGDPGIVQARRLSNAEYNYTIRDLTGQDLQITREFPIDPANPAGFDNSAESLTMSPALLNKYLQAAREVSNHMVLLPDRIAFSPNSMLVETDREKYAVQRIVNFYLNQPTKFADYFQAAWKYKYRSALKTPRATLNSIAIESKLSPKYLPMVWEILHEKDAVGPILKLQKMWQSLPAPGANQPELLASTCKEMQDFVIRIRKHTGMQFIAPKVKGLPEASQPLLNWKLHEYAANRRKSDPKALRNDTDPAPVMPEIPKYPGLHRESAYRWAALINQARATDTDLIVPAAERSRYEAAFSRFASVFPDQFFITERGRYFPDDSQDKGRLLSAGYHSVLGFYRDDTPLMEMILDEKGKQEIDRLWNEFDFVADFTARTWIQYFFNQSGEVQGRGAESATDRPVDHEVTDSEVIIAMKNAYLAKAAADPSNDPIAAHAIEDHYDRINTALRSVEKQRIAAEPRHLESALKFASQAYRRPLTKSEQDDLLAYYQTLRSTRELSHVDAVRELIVNVLTSPDFLFRIDLPQTGKPVSSKGKKPSDTFASQPLTSYELASRLSYFLWSSKPDEELLKLAATGTLQKKDVLLAQTRRMLKDPKVSGLATEFTGNWLTFRHFQKNNSVDRERYPTFTNDLRDAMFLEPVKLLEDAFTHNRSALDLIYGDYTFVNPVLAKHYGISGVEGDNSKWVQINGAGKYGRGGLLPMSVFLTVNSPGLRTSPVKRGNWVVQRILGDIVPPPPPLVPELPEDEAKSELPVRQMLAKHRENELCAACHSRIDSFGLAFEGYGPVGDRREKDLAGRPVDTKAEYPGGITADGVSGLKTFIRENRQDGYITNISRKLLAYALNRSLQLSDESLIGTMRLQAKDNDYRLNTLIETIVTSPQFLNKRISEPGKVFESKLQSREVKP